MITYRVHWAVDEPDDGIVVCAATAQEAIDRGRLMLQAVRPNPHRGDAVCAEPTHCPLLEKIQRDGERARAILLDDTRLTLERARAADAELARRGIFKRRSKP